MLASKDREARLGKTVPSRKIKTNQPRLVPTPAALGVAVALAVSGGLFLPHDADAAGLGRLTVQSALGQPLQAEVEITSLSPDESSSLSAKLATPEAFRQAGLEYNPALTGLNFRIDRRSDGRAVVRISSARPINEPFVDLLVELNWASGKFAREYTFLLDPPELQVGRANTVEGTGAAPVAPQVAAASPAPAPAAAMTAPAARAAAPAPQAPAPAAAPPAQAPAQAPVAQRPAAAPAPAPAPSRPASVEVGRGDTLAAIAEQVRPSGVSLNQAIVSIYRANPDAFFGGVHQMRSGQTLSIPSEGEMRSLSSAEVAAEMRSSLRAFNEYRNRLASNAREVGGQQGGQQASGAVGQAQQPAESAVAGDQLRLSTGGTGTGVAGAATGSQAADSAEVSVARDNALRESQSRVEELEKNVGDLQRLLELKNRQLADLEQQLTQARQAGTAATGTIAAPAPSTTADAAATAAGVASGAEAAAGSAPDSAPAATDSTPAGATDTDTAAGQSSAPMAGATSGQDSPAAADSMGTAPTESTTTPAEPAAQAPAMAGSDAQAPAESAAPVPVPAPAAEASAPAVTPAPAAEPAPAPATVPSFLDELRENPYVLLGGGALILLGGFYMWYSHRRRKSAENFEDSLGGTDAFTANSLFGTTGGQNVDTSNSLFSTNIRDSGVDVHSTEVDPIAEAEVYIAYGREAQAEEILKEALKKQPERHAIRLKLLEIHAGRKDVASFNELAREMYEQAGGTNEEWPKVVTLGLSIDPENSLYTGRDDGDVARSGGIGAAGAAGAMAGAAGLIEALDSPPGTSADEPQARAESDAISDLDFSLPGDTQDTFASTTAVSPDPAGEPVDDSGLDFSIDIDSRIGDSDDPSSFGEDAISDIDLPSLDLGEPAAPAGPGQPGGTTSTSESELSRALDGRIDLPSLDLGDDAGFATTGVRRVASEVAADLGDFNVDIPSLETLRGPADVEATAVDLSSIGLDLSPESISGPGASGDGSRWQEMATKLDLASAYEEIGDKEGARELLEEVVRGGDSEQQQKARSMLSKIN